MNAEQTSPAQTVSSERLLAAGRDRQRETKKIYDEGKHSEGNQRSGWCAMMQGRLDVWDEVLRLIAANIPDITQ